ncbi:MAG: TIGR02757 family protein, partial [Deltaproteobacteria bacterium]|nr:TIGR02757 family protein [Deltaproteobacteria bacterium]
ALKPLGPHPARAVLAAPDAWFADAYGEFRHRFCKGWELAGLLLAARRVLEEYGSLERAFAAGLSPGDETVMPALCAFGDRLSAAGCPAGHLAPNPNLDSACKRWHLYLRWMVRKDAVDPGCWESVPPSLLVVPMDVHMHRVCRSLGFTARKAANLKAALEATEGFRALCPQDPVRYDFCLTKASQAGEKIGPAAG